MVDFCLVNILRDKLNLQHLKSPLNSNMTHRGLSGVGWCMGAAFHHWHGHRLPLESLALAQKLGIHLDAFDVPQVIRKSETRFKV